jgi:hypothetical protein
VFSHSGAKTSRVPHFSRVLCARSGEFSARPARCVPAILCHPDRSEAITLSSRPQRSGVEGPCVSAAQRKRSSCPSRRKAASFTSGQSRRQYYRDTGRSCHPERSNCFAQRSGCAVEGPRPAQIGRRPSANSPMLALTNSLRQSISASVSVPAWLAIWDNCASCSGVKWTSPAEELKCRVPTLRSRSLVGDGLGKIDQYSTRAVQRNLAFLKQKIFKGIVAKVL